MQEHKIKAKQYRRRAYIGLIVSTLLLVGLCETLRHLDIQRKRDAEDVQEKAQHWVYYSTTRCQIVRHEERATSKHHKAAGQVWHCPVGQPVWASETIHACSMNLEACFDLNDRDVPAPDLENR